MTSKELIQKLALERCRLNLSHICALNHLVGEDVSEENSHDSVVVLIENLNKDFELIEGLIMQEA